MKQLLFVFSFLMLVSFSANAQACNKKADGKACCASKKAASVDASADATQVASAYMEADAVAEKNENISKRTCEKSGATTYFEKSVCSTSGKISWSEVSFDSETKTFTQVASASMEKDENGAKVEKKACAGSTSGKACCASKKASDK
jgi:hypothetical protein